MCTWMPATRPQLFESESTRAMAFAHSAPASAPRPVSAGAAPASPMRTRTMGRFSGAGGGVAGVARPSRPSVAATT